MVVCVGESEVIFLTIIDKKLFYYFRFIIWPAVLVAVAAKFTIIEFCQFGFSKEMFEVDLESFLESASR